MEVFSLELRDYLKQLTEIAEEMGPILSAVPGVVDIMIEQVSKSIKLSMVPSLSHVRSTMVALNEGSSCKRWIGMVGSSCLIGQVSGTE